MSDLLGAQEQINQLLKQIDPYRFSVDQYGIPRMQNLNQMREYLRGFNERNDERQDQLRWLNYALRGKEHYRDNPNNPAEQRAELTALRDNSQVIMQDANEKAEMTRRIAKENGINLAGFTANDTIKQSEENLMNESLKAIDEVYHGKFGKSSDQFYDERYQYYIGQGMDKDTAMRLAREEGTMYKYMKIQYMRDVTPEVINGGRIENSQQLAWIAKVAEEDPMFAQMLLNGNVLPGEQFTHDRDRNETLQDRALDEASKSALSDQRFQNSLALIMQGYENQRNLNAQRQGYTQTNMATANNYNTNLEILRHKLGIDKIKYQGETDANLTKYKHDLDDRNAINEYNRSIKMEDLKMSLQLRNRIELAKYKAQIKDDDFWTVWDRYSSSLTPEEIQKNGWKTADDIFNWFTKTYYGLDDKDRKDIAGRIKATRTDSDDKVLNTIGSYVNDLENAIQYKSKDEIQEKYEELMEYMESDKFRESAPETKMQAMEQLKEVMKALGDPSIGIVNPEEWGINPQPQPSNQGNTWEPPSPNNLPTNFWESIRNMFGLQTEY